VDERRQNHRYDTYNARLEVHNSVDDRPLGTVSNLSAGGMMLIAHQQLYPGGILQLVVDGPADAECGDISLGVRVLWCVPAHSPEEFWAGLETVDISPDSEAGLRRLLDYLAAAD
jgi:hypothetical protein